jgi:hypothetical protein
MIIIKNKHCCGGKMPDDISSRFLGIEIQKRQQIVSLMSDWQSEITRKYEIEPDPEYWEGYPPISYFISDGFFPGYYNQKIKALFIGRETRHMADEGDWIKHTIKNYENDNKQNRKKFTRCLLYIIQGIKNKGKLKFENLKTANDYAKEMASTNDYGFAFMNMSKYTNITGKSDADYDFINKFLEDSNLEYRNYFREELEILSPDVIITLHLWNGGIDQRYLDLCFGKIEWEKTNDAIDGKVNMSNIVLNGKSIKLLDTYHFASRYPEKEYFYDPVMEILFK